MRLALRYICSVVLLLVAVFSLLTNWYVFLVTVVAVVLTVMLLDKMGKGIVLRESTALLYSLTCLVMPMVGYAFYTIDNSMARLWVKYMPVSEEVYFSFALPAISVFCFALTLPLRSHGLIVDEGERLNTFVTRIKDRQLQWGSPGFQIMLVGTVIGFIVQYLPGGLRFFGQLFFFSSFAGLLLVYFSPSFRFKNLVIAGFALFIAGNALRSGMFTIVAYMGITIFSFFLLRKKLSFLRKFLVLLLGVFSIIVLQNVKVAYRELTWKQGFEGSKVEIFTNLFAENLMKGESLLENKAFFAIYARTNQGFNVALVMKRFPEMYPHDNGANLAKAFASALVPRLLWPDKMEAGGKFNMKYYAGIYLRGWSTNIGPLGEAYGGFGVAGGIIYMFLLGLFIRWAYSLLFKKAVLLPLLLCWMPVLFYQVTYSAETDSLQIFNSLFKSALFLWIISKILPSWIGLKSSVMKKHSFLNQKVTNKRNSEIS